MSDTLSVPHPSAVSAPFWDGTRRRELTMQRCESCSRLVWYPRFVCPHCGDSSLRWEKLSGNGVVYAVSVHHRAALPALADKVPYAVVLVDLDEGVRLMSNVFGSAPAVGDRVAAAWVPLDDGRHLAVFEPE
jgi:uncharacterized OB-fold protein